MNSFRPRKLFIALVTVCAFAAAAFAQDKDWRPISPEDLQSKAPAVEPDADAEAIFWETRIDDSDSSDLTLRHYVRVKIYTERGRERYSKFDIPYFRGRKIKDLFARVVRPDGSSVEVTKEDVFDREIVRAGGLKVKAKSFAVPNIEPGVIVEYRYREAISDDDAIGMRLDFQRDIPVKTLSYYYKPNNSKEPSYQPYNLTDVRWVKDQNGYWLATRANVPAFKEEPRMPPLDTVRPYMVLTGSRSSVVSLSNFSVMVVEKDQRDWKKYWAGVSGQWAAVAKSLTIPDGDIKKAAQEITAGASSPEEKLRRIYEFCQKEIKNVTYDTTMTDEEKKKFPPPRSIADVLKQKAGRWWNIDVLFANLATAAGFEARVALVGDRSRAFFQPDMPDQRLVHLGGIAIRDGGEFKIYNPGNAFQPFGTIGWHEEDTWALASGVTDFFWQKTRPSSEAASLEKRTGKFTLSEDGTLEGDVRIESTGHPAKSYRLDNYDETAAKREDGLKNAIKARISTAEVSNVTIENLTDISKPLVTQYHIRVPAYAQKTGKRLFLQPNFFEYGTTAVFASATRKYDIYFRYPWSESDDLTIQLPSGFALDSADAPGTIVDPTKISTLKIDIGINSKANVLSYKRNFFFGSGGRVLFPPTSYAPLKNLWDTFYTADTHTLTLKQQ